MKENREFKGFWFLPSNPELKIPGILYFDKKKEIRLELIGSFHKDLFESLEIPKEKNHTILGITSQNKKISIFNCYRSKSNWNFSSSYGLVEYKGNQIVIGKHFLDNDETFNSINLSFSNLHSWYGKNIIERKIKYPKEQKLPEFEFSIPKPYKENETYQIEKGIILKLINTSGLKTLKNHSGYEITQHTIIEIKSLNAKKSIMFFLNKVKLLKDFFTLINLDEISIESLNVYDDDNFQKTQNSKKISHNIETLIIDKNLGKDNYELLFRFREVEKFLPLIFDKWFNIGQKFIPIRNHLISSIIRKGTFTSLDFLIIVQSLEGYHRRFMNDKKLHLKNRIESLIHYFKDVKKVKISTKEITYTIKSRHYYSHFYEDDSNVLYGIDLYNLTMKLRVLLICCVLDLTGFEKKLINTLLEKNQKL